MAKVSAFPSAVAADNYVDATNPRGEVSAHTFVNVRNIFGQDCIRRISLGRCPATLSEAKQMIGSAREAQPAQQVSAQFTIYL